METNVRKIIEAGEFPTTREAAIELINKVDALKKIETIRKEEESEESEKRPIQAHHVYIKPIFKDKWVRHNDKGEKVGEFIYNKVGPTVFKEVILALNKDEANKYIQRMIDRERTEVKINKAKRMMVIGRHNMRKIMAKVNKKYINKPIIGFRTFRREGYKILRRTYLKPSVRALAKAEVNFF